MKNLTTTQLEERKVIIAMMEERGMDVAKYMNDDSFLKIINAMAASGAK